MSSIDVNEIWPSWIQASCSRPDSDRKYLARMYWMYSGVLFFSSSSWSDLLRPRKSGSDLANESTSFEMTVEICGTYFVNEIQRLESIGAMEMETDCLN